VMPWPEDDLWKIRKAVHPHISPFRDDGKTSGAPTWIWSVVVDGRKSLPTSTSLSTRDKQRSSLPVGLRARSLTEPGQMSGLPVSTLCVHSCRLVSLCPLEPTSYR
jgi:hypothetical protein